MIRTLTFYTDGNVLKKVGDFKNIPRGSSLRGRFILPEEWKDKAAAVSFYYDEKEYPEMIEGEYCNIPKEVTEGDRFSLRISCMDESGGVVKTEKAYVRMEV